MGHPFLRKKASGSKETAQKPRASVKNREFAVITYCFFGLFLSMMGYFVYFQTEKGEDFINNPYNARQETFSRSVLRGKIYSSDGKVLAETKTGEDGTETRVYPYGNLFSHAVGYSSEQYGRAGVESWANFNLLRSSSFFLEKTIDKVTDEKSIGDDVVTTLDVSLQNAAYQALGSYQGAIVAMHPKTGQILAMASKPDFDPNTVTQDWESIVEDAGGKSPLLNRASQGLYPPGSTFKIVTALQYLREHPNEFEDYSYVCNGSIQKDGSRLSCYGGNVHGNVDLLTSFLKSCNTSFANIGLSLDVGKFRKTAKELLFNQSLPVEKLDASKSSFALGTGSSESEVMETAIGQGKTLVTPLHMLMIVSAIANRGELMRPFIIDYTKRHDGDVVKWYPMESYGQIMTEEEAEILQSYMKETALRGTASKLSGMSYQAYGKTGSAEFGANKGDSHAWFVGYAEREDKDSIAVAVILEGAGAGSAYAVPAAKGVFDVYFNQ